MILEARSLKKTFTSETGEILTILSGADLSVEAATLTAITGPSGCGKSTLLHLLGGLDRPDQGEILWDGRPISALDTTQLSQRRNTFIGFVFQFHHLLPEFSALENVAMPALIAGRQKREAESEARALLERVGLSHRADHRPRHLSGGEQQRVAIARALMNRPPLILADEPTGNLDQAHSEEILTLLLGLRDDEQVSILIVTHDPSIASRCDRRMILDKGILLQA